LNPLSALFGAGVEIRNRLYDRGTFRANRLQAPVISVGSISVGGAGKTPFLIMLGEHLKQRGLTFDVLSRGYGRKTTGVMLVDPAGLPQQFGDEPLLIARQMGVPVIIGEDRYAAGQFAEGKFGPQVHLLDDGFQHRRLARDFDIVLITEHDLHDALLPVGRLREPLSSLSRASAVVLMDGVSPEQVPLREGQSAWRVSRSIVPPETSDTYFAFCGIARPQSFFAELRKAGVHLAGTHEFDDHYSYGASDVQLLLRLRQQSGATAFITTEKDEVNLGGYLHQMQPVRIVPVRMHFEPAPERIAGAADRSTSLIEQLYSFIVRQNPGCVRE
jgi:tetraacyldisaccharide 4'-kinase